MRTWISALALILAGIVLLPATATADEKYIISAETWGYYQEYLGNIKNGRRPGAYAISTDGYSSYYVWCREMQCMPGATYSQEAINGCERETNSDCVVFAVRDDIRVEYEIAGKAVSATAAPALSPPPPVSNLTISASVKAEIDQYLRNAQRAGRVWALAIANDGSRVGVASCQATGGGGYFGGGGAGCNLVSGGPQEQASREALLRCGGTTACMLLYEGSTKKANINVYGAGEAPPPASAIASVTPASTAPSPPPPATKIVVSAAVKAEIDAYLGNAQRAGRASALAISQDGSEVAAASCPTSGGWSGGRACDPVKGSPQELAIREAIVRCGGAAACVLLYEDTQPTSKIEIVTQ